jgi:hypothetical protein
MCLARLARAKKHEGTVRASILPRLELGLHLALEHSVSIYGILQKVFLKQKVIRLICF